ncbi:MAG: glycoside hydrolase family 127 protein, partial [Clostridia bacterium]
SAWLGGNGEAWERGPYYLDGLISLAYLLDDEVLINKANVWIEKILLSVDVNGFFGPKRTNDWWPRTIAIKALTSYAEATGDRQILPFVRNYFKYQFNEIDNQPMYAWASARALEELLPLKYLYDNTGDEMVLELIKKLKEGSYDWFGVYENFKFKRYAKYYLSKNIINIAKRFGAKNDEKKKSGTAPLKPMTKQKILKRNKRRTVKKLMLTHGVNNAMAVKYPVLYSEFFPSDELEILSKKAVQTLLKYHGTAVGVFTSDEQLNGASPVQGIELCTVVEFMRSLESLMQITGDMYYADLLELVAFNALPASINKNFTAHQYVQQVNQISATRDKRDFFDVGSDGTIFGLSPNYGCCTANMHQGFPKFTEHLCMRHGSELAFLIYAPCSIDTEVDGVKIKLTETTDYPFKNDVKITVDAVSGNPDITFTFRIPQYASAILS